MLVPESVAFGKIGKTMMLGRYGVLWQFDAANKYYFRGYADKMVGRCSFR